MRFTLEIVAIVLFVLLFFLLLPPANYYWTLWVERWTMR